MLYYSYIVTIALLLSDNIGLEDIRNEKWHVKICMPFVNKENLGKMKYEIIAKYL